MTNPPTLRYQPRPCSVAARSRTGPTLDRMTITMITITTSSSSPKRTAGRWRRKIRQNKRQLAVYRVAVGVLGLLLIALGLVSGPLPGPGGIPLVLLGLAVWSSEFEWAHQLMLWFKKQLHRYRTWSTPKKVLFWVVFFACCGLLGYCYLLALGIPGWLPGSVDVVLQRLPGSVIDCSARADRAAGTMRP